MTQRRDFIKKSILGTAGITIGGMGFSAKSYASIIGANDRFRIAVCGVNGRGKSHISGFSKQDNVEIAYLVDPDSLILENRVNQLREQEEGISNRVKGVADVRHVLDDKEIDAIIVYKLDRLARNMVDYTGLVATFSKLGISIYKAQSNSYIKFI